MTTAFEKQFSRAYGLNEIALVPSDITLDTALVDISTTIAGQTLALPIIASAMDSVVSPETAGLIGKHGGAGVLNLEGVQTRYDDPKDILQQIAAVDKKEYVSLMQKIYKTDIKTTLVTELVQLLMSRGQLLLLWGMREFVLQTFRIIRTTISTTRASMK